MSSSMRMSNRLRRNGNTDRRIKLIASRQNYRIKLQEFAKCSLKIQKLWENGRLPKHINISSFDEEAVKTLIGYIRNENQKNIQLPFYALVDLIDLSRSLLMLDLFQQLENILVKIARQKTDSLIQALIIVGKERSIFTDLSARQKIEEIAATKFRDVVQHELFGYIPPIVFTNIIARCDLDIDKEINVVDAAIAWIWQQEKLLISCALVFPHIRSAFLTRGDRDTIQECLRTLPYGGRMIPFIMTTLSSTFSGRCCVIKEHIDRGAIRCGVPNLSDDVTINLRKLPLSRKFSVKQIWEDQDKRKRSSEGSEMKKKALKRKYVKEQKGENNEDSSKFIQSATISKSSKSDKNKTSQESEENMENESTRRKRRKSGKNDSERCKTLRNAMRKKIYNNKNESGQTLHPKKNK